MNATLKRYLGDRQTDALLLENLLSTATICTDGTRNELLFSLIEAALETARKLNRDLDAVNLPEGGAA